jgi:hypothetical protein
MDVSKVAPKYTWEISPSLMYIFGMGWRASHSFSTLVKVSLEGALKQH